MTDNIEIAPQKFCSDCGLSLVKLDGWCSSRDCGKCRKEVFFVRRAEDGGIKLEKGDKFHIPSLTMSLDPNEGGQFTRYGLENFIKQLFLGEKVDEENLIEKFKTIEANIDKELLSLDCIEHCDLENESSVEEALAILEREGLKEYQYNLLRSISIRDCYKNIEEGNALRAVWASNRAEIYKEFSLLEMHHFKEIMWLGYTCYIDLNKNDKATVESVKQQKLINSVLPKIKALNNETLFAYSQDDEDIAPRIATQGLTESTLTSLLKHEIEDRNSKSEKYFQTEDLKVKNKANSLKALAIVFTLVNGAILALYKNWLG
jgi:hypothetical protein